MYMHNYKFKKMKCVSQSKSATEICFGSPIVLIYYRGRVPIVSNIVMLVEKAYISFMKAVAVSSSCLLFFLTCRRLGKCQRDYLL